MLGIDLPGVSYLPGYTTAKRTAAVVDRTWWVWDHRKWLMAGAGALVVLWVVTRP